MKIMDHLSFGKAAAGTGIAVGLGLFSGVLFLTSFVLLQQNIRKNGVVLAATFMKLGVLIPTLMAIIIFRERPGFFQISGIILAIVAIIMIHFEKESVGAVLFKEKLSRKKAAAIALIFLALVLLNL